VIAESRRLAAVQTPVIPIVSRWIAETPGTISLGQGVVSYGPPGEAIAALNTFPASLADHRYGAVEGEPALIAAIETKLASENGIAASPDRRVVVTTGSNQAFMAALLAVADTGAEVILLAPYYFNHEMAIVMAGCRPVAVPTTRDYQLDLDGIARAITPRTAAVVTVSPNNPTGAVYPEASLRALNALCASRGIVHIHDEAYEYFTYGGARTFSPGAIPSASAHTISLFTLSKAFGMASWRIGWMVIPAALWEAVNKIQDTIAICPPLVSQHVALAAMRVGAVYPRGHLARLERIRARALATLTAADVPCDVPAPDGAFYLFARLRGRADDAMAVAERLIREHRVAVIPGSAFGTTGGCCLRVSFGALDEDAAAEGTHRLAEGLKALLR